MEQTFKPRLSFEEYVNGLFAGNRIILSQAITLVESSKREDQQLASQLIDKIIHKTGNSIRLGITGVPGVGKSTFIEAMGKHLTDLQKRVAVLTIDPTSQVTKGSIMGDKTRMDTLAKNPLAYIRPSSSGKASGGVSRKTRESILLCEAAGYDVIIVETVGVGQTEVAVKNMTDFFLLLMLAGAGDELQGIKKGIMEMADAIAITKADGENIAPAKAAQAEYQHALQLTGSPSNAWAPQVLTCSAQNNTGIDTLWKVILNFKQQTEKAGEFQRTRQKQQSLWMKEIFDQYLHDDVARNETLLKKQRELEGEIINNHISPPAAAKQLFDTYRQSFTDKIS